MALCQNVRRSLPYIFDCTSRRWEETGTTAAWLKYYRRNRENRFSVTHFWPTLHNHVTDGSKHMRQLDRGEIKLFSPRCLYASIFNISEIYGLKSRNGEKFEFFSNFLANPVETPWPILTVLQQNVRRSVPYILDHIWHRWEKKW